jgi:hypothetical protein
LVQFILAALWVIDGWLVTVMSEVARGNKSVAPFPESISGGMERDAKDARVGWFRTIVPRAACDEDSPPFIEWMHPINCGRR